MKGHPIPIRGFALASLLLLGGTAAFAQATTDSVIADYREQGFTRIEVRSGANQIKVEAFRGREKVEAIIDKATGAVLKRETGVAGAFDNTAPGILRRESNRDFLRTSSSDGSGDDESDDDDRSGQGGSDDGVSGSDSSNDDRSGNDGSDDEGSGDDGSRNGGSGTDGADDGFRAGDSPGDDTGGRSGGSDDDGRDDGTENDDSGRSDDNGTDHDHDDTGSDNDGPDHNED